MKLNYFQLKGFLPLLLILTIVSCSVEKRIYNKGYAVQWKTFKNDNTSEDKSKDFVSSKVILKAKTKKENQDNASTSKAIKPSKDKKSKSTSQAEAAVFNYVSNPDSVNCKDILTKKNGDELIVKVHSIVSGVIRYEKCDDNKDGYYYIKTSELFMLKFENGVKEVYGDAPSEESKEVVSTEKGVHPLSLISTLAGLVSFIVFGLPLGLVALITGIIAINKISSSDEFTGGFFAILGILLGITAIVLMLIYFSTL